MRARVVPVLALIATLAACGREAETRQYELEGQILGIEPSRNEVLIRHEDIEGFMPAMTMPFTVEDPALLDGKQPGDLVTATLVVGEVRAYLSTLAKTGRAPLETLAAASDVQRILAPGDEVAGATLVDQNGTARPFSSFRGHRVALTFIYTRCPLPEFCPLMDRHFAAVQKTIAATPALADVRLVSMTLDPEFDTPAVLKAHAARQGADQGVWSFVTAEPEVAADFASQFGLYVERNPDNPIDIIHNLVTVVVDANGRLAARHTGNDWTPAQLVADLQAAAAAAD